MPQRQLTVEEILNGTGLGGMQSVGQMAVIPILDEGGAQDESWAPPNFAAGTTDYSHIRVQNQDADRPTIVPTGTGFVSKQRAQDHASPGAALIKAGQNRTLDNCICIEETQGGLIRQEKDTEMLILPAALRGRALSLRSGSELGRLWPYIRRFKKSFGISEGSGNLVDFLRRFEKELDQFVAEFEIVPRQVGAVVLIGDKVVGIERAPNVSFWEALWTPLVRVCYGSLALRAREVLKDQPPAHRVGLNVKVKSLAGIHRALRSATVQVKELAEAKVAEVAGHTLALAAGVEESLGSAKLRTVASPLLAGQILQQDGKTPYASLCAAGAENMK